MMSYLTRFYADSSWFQSYMGCSFGGGVGGVEAREHQKTQKAPKGNIFENSEKPPKKCFGLIFGHGFVHEL